MSYLDKYTILESFHKNTLQNLQMGYIKSDPNHIVVINVLKDTSMICTNGFDQYIPAFSSVLEFEQSDGQCVMITDYHEGHPLEKFIDHFHPDLQLRLKLAHQFFDHLRRYSDLPFYLLDKLMDPKHLIVKDNELHHNELLMYDADYTQPDKFDPISVKIGRILTIIVPDASDRHAQSFYTIIDDLLHGGRFGNLATLLATYDHITARYKVAKSASTLEQETPKDVWQAFAIPVAGVMASGGHLGNDNTLPTEIAPDLESIPPLTDESVQGTESEHKSTDPLEGAAVLGTAAVLASSVAFASSDTIQTPDVPESTDVIESTDVPESPDALESTDVPESPDMTESTEVPDVLEAREASEVPEVPEVPEVSEVSEVPEVPEVPEVHPLSDGFGPIPLVVFPEPLEPHEFPDMPDQDLFHDFNHPLESDLDSSIDFEPEQPIMSEPEEHIEPLSSEMPSVEELEQIDLAATDNLDPSDDDPYKTIHLQIDDRLKMEANRKKKMWLVLIPILLILLGIIGYTLMKPLFFTSSQPPLAEFTQTKDGHTWVFTSTATSDPNLSLKAHQWTLSKSGITLLTTTEKDLTYAFTEPGTYDVSLKVMDSKLKWSSPFKVSVAIEADSLPLAPITPTEAASEATTEATTETTGSSGQASSAMIEDQTTARTGTSSFKATLNNPDSTLPVLTLTKMTFEGKGVLAIWLKTAEQGTISLEVTGQSQNSPTFSTTIEAVDFPVNQWFLVTQPIDTSPMDSLLIVVNGTVKTLWLDDISLETIK